MPDVVQQCGRDQGGRRAALMREVGGLEGVFPLGNGLAAVGGIASFGEQPADFCDRPAVVCRHSHVLHTIFIHRF